MNPGNDVKDNYDSMIFSMSLDEEQLKRMKNLMPHGHKKQTCKKNSTGVRNIFSCEKAINADESQSTYFTDERATEPLCWEELLNSDQVKSIKPGKVRTMAMAHCSKENAVTRPVVFHQKNSIEEVLKRQKVRFHLTSRHLPELQSRIKEKTTKVKYKPKVKCLSSTQWKINDVSFNDRLELRGSGMQSPLCNTQRESENDTGKIPEEKDDTDVRREWYDNELSQQEDEDTRVQINDSTSRRNNLQIRNNTSSLHRKYAVEIPVSVPNPALTDESCSLVSETGELRCETKSIHDKMVKCNETCDEEKPSTNKLQNISNDTEKSERKSVTETTIHVVTPRNGSEKKTFRKNLSNVSIATGTGSHTPIESYEVRTTSSRLTYTPSTPPLFLSCEIVELPRGVLPSKALKELRQTFRQNIRRETEQLQFDLQELYLKKQLHQR